MSFADLYGQAISEQLGVPVQVENLAVDAATSGDLLESLGSDTSTAQALAGAEIVTVSVGFNDIFDGIESYAAGDCGGQDGEACLRHDVATMRSNFAKILDRVSALAGSQPQLVLVTNDYNEYIGDPALIREIGADAALVVDRYVRLINATRCRAATARGVPCADLYRAFDGHGTTSPLAAGLLASDGHHPSEAGQHLIAETLLGLGLAPLG